MKEWDFRCFCCACCAAVDQSKSEIATRTWNWDTYAGNHVCRVLQTPGVCIIWAGPDHHTTHYKTSIQLIIMKSSSLYMSLCTRRHIHTLSSVSFTGYMNELRHDSPRLSYTYTHTRANRGKRYELIIRQDHLHNIQACLLGAGYIL